MKNRTQRGQGGSQGTMAEALTAAGIMPTKKDGRQVEEKPLTITNDQKSDSTLWQEACDGAVKIDNDEQRIAWGKKNQKQKQPSAKKRQKKAQRQQQIENNVFVGVDGEVRKLATGPGKKAVSAVTSPYAKFQENDKAISNRLRTTPNTVVNSSVLKADEEHLYSDFPLVKEHRTPVSQQEGEIDLVIGLDFGTTYCKAVIQESSSGRAWAIPFTESTNNPYILPTNILHHEGVFRLQGAGDSIGNLKVPLLTGKMLPGHLLNVVAFFALIIRYIKLWVKVNKADELTGMKPLWYVNIGLPAKNLEQSKMKANFTCLIWAGMALSEVSGSEVTKKEAQEALLAAFHAVKSGEKYVLMKGGVEIHKEQIGIFPEIAAQIYGYLKSDMWDHSQNIFLLVDVGGGTVDGAIFRVVESNNGELSFVVLKSSVEQFGVFILHQKRLAWHLSQLEGNPDTQKLQDDIRKLIGKDATPVKVPSAIDEYLISANYPDITIDTEFYKDFRQMVWIELIQSVLSHDDIRPDAFDNLPFLLCGGGRSIGLYNDFLRLMNRPDGPARVRLKTIGMRRPSSLEGTGLGEAIYQRISVAYGLSFFDIGKVLMTGPNDSGEPPPIDAHRRNYIGLEMM